MNILDSRPGGFVRHRFTNSLELNAKVFLDQVQVQSLPGHNLVTYESWLTLAPNDRLRFDVGSNRSTFDNVTSLAKGITGAYATFSMDVIPTDRTIFSTRFNWGDYSDGNQRTWGQLELQYKLLTRQSHTRPVFSAGARYTAFGFSQNLDNGYFNPSRYESAAATAHLNGLAGKRLEYDLDGSFGAEHALPGGNKPITTGSIRVRYRMAARVDLDGRYESFSSREASSSGFSRQTAKVAVHFRW
jgi:hypothetical protein